MGKLQTPPNAFSRGWLGKLDGRYSVAQEMRERFDAYTSDLGGLENLSYAQRSLVERGLWLEYWLAQQERELATGGELDVGRWVQAANSLQGIMSRLGLQRQAKDVPSLNQFLANRKSAS